MNRITTNLSVCSRETIYGSPVITEIFFQTSYRLCYKGGNLGYYVAASKIYAKPIGLDTGREDDDFSTSFVGINRSYVKICISFAKSGVAKFSYPM